MSHYLKLLPHGYLGAFDLSDEQCRPRDVTLTIASCAVEEVQNDDGKKPKAVVRFAKTDKALIAGKTVLGLIATALDTGDAAQWVGRSVTLYPSRTMFGRDVCDCIRVRLPKGMTAQDSRFLTRKIKKDLARDARLGEPDRVTPAAERLEPAGTGARAASEASEAGDAD